MAGLSDTAENSLALLLFLGTAWTGVAQNHSSPATVTPIALHSADPGDAGNQSTSEVSATSYARASVARTSGGWTGTGNTINPTANIDFATITGGSATAAFASVAVNNTTTGAIAHLVAGAVTPSIALANGVTARLTTASAITFD